MQIVLDISELFWTFPPNIFGHGSKSKIQYQGDIFGLVQNRFGPLSLERQGILKIRYAEGLGMILNLVTSKQNIIMISSSLLDILQELMPKLSRKSCVVHSMAIKKTTMCLQ